MDFDTRPPHHQHSDVRSTPGYVHAYPTTTPIKTTSESPKESSSQAPRQWLPDIGQTRCYWALLSSSLKFLVLDPVLQFHLKEQATHILDKSLLDFVHPDEKDSARADLGGVLEAKTLHGSITRVRYCRLSCVRRMLGFVPSPETPAYPPSFPADRISIDANYMAVDIVINWVAEGLVLCFIHAVVDIMPEDNDEVLRTGWSNWCSTYGFTEEQSSAMCRSLHERVPSSASSSDGSMRILQILRNEPERSLLMSWPPDQPHREGALEAWDLAQLVKHVNIDGGGGEAKTSCTRRFKSSRVRNVADTYGSYKRVEVESIFIPHGTIIFACHKVNNVQDGATAYAPGTNAYALPVPNGFQNPFAQAHDARGYPDQASMYGPPSYPEDGVHQPVSTQTYVERWVEGQSHAHMPVPQEESWSQIGSTTSSPVISHNRRLHIEPDMSAGPDTYIPYAQPQHPWTNSSYHTSAYAHSRNGSTRPQSPALTANTHYTPSIPTADTPLRMDSQGGSPAASQTADLSQSPGAPPTAMDEDSPKAGKSPSIGETSAGGLRCTSCGVTHSPEWRKGPSGKKDLCNACGLRFARSRAKKEGVAVRKRPSGKQMARPAASGSGPSRTAPAERARAPRSFSRGSKHQASTETRATSKSFASTLLDASYLVSLAHSAPAPSYHPPLKDIPIDPSLTAGPSNSPSPPTSSAATSSNYTGSGSRAHARPLRHNHRTMSQQQPFTPPDSSYGLPTPSPKYSSQLHYERQRHDGKHAPADPQSYIPHRHSTDNSLKYALGNGCTPADKLFNGVAGGAAHPHLPPTPLSASHSFVRGEPSKQEGYW